MFEPIQIAFSFCSGGLAGAIIGHRLRISSEAAARRRAFRDFVASLDDDFTSEWKEVGVMAADEFQNWGRLASHFASIPKVKAEAIKVREDIRFWKRRRFKAACTDYYDFGAGVSFESNHAEFANIRKKSGELLETLSKCAS